jgi:hypothetical protein
VADRAGGQGFTRWLRSTSETHLKQAAQLVVARRYGGRLPPPARGAQLFWLKVYAPAYHLLPAGLRNALIARMPGSHRQTWTYQSRASGPAGTLTQVSPAPTGTVPPGQSLPHPAEEAP